ncbi:MAG: hypothetical protein IJ060_08925 [Oscillospiraceae bacterium]|nr:hypothetical protein [Oscillospiraceae bacterium]
MKELLRQISDFLRNSFLILLVLISAVFGIYRLVNLQIIEASEAGKQKEIKAVYTQVIPATRGEIVDCNGAPIVSNKIGYNLIIEKAYFPTDNREGNAVIYRIVSLLKETGYGWNDTIPVSRTQPYSFERNRDNDVKELKQNLNLNSYATAENCIDKLISDYEIDDPEYTDEERRIIAGIRYEMLLRHFSMSNVFYLSNDIDLRTVTRIKELRLTMNGVNIVEEAIRTVENGDVIPHEIGYVGPIYSQEEYHQLLTNGHEDYALSDTVGKSGLELACEPVLRGINGKKEITVINGDVASVAVTEEAVGGQTIQLTVNSGLQADLQTLLEEHCEWLRETQKECKNANCGAIVLLDTKDNAVLSMATLPTYNLAELLEDYNAVAEQENSPLVNRATDGLYRPGSTFKPITATAGLDSGVISGSTKFDCETNYRYIDMIFHCTGKHHEINVTRALTVSCNIFFYELSTRLGLDRLLDYERMYGLGAPLGLESGDSGGYLACPETFEQLNETWYVGELLQAAIGQSEVQVTPLQMAVVASTIANKGNRYRPHLIDSYWDNAHTQMLSEKEPELVQTVAQNNAESVYGYIREGMIGAAQTAMPASYDLNSLGIDVAIKTGTPQRTKTRTDSFVIGFAPAENPEVAFCAMVEDGKYAKYMVKGILEAYAKQYPDSQIGRAVRRQARSAAS